MAMLDPPIAKALVVNVEPDSSVKQSMNDSWLNW